MCDAGKILNICDNLGNIEAVIVPIAIWRKIEPYYKKTTETAARKEDLKGFEDLLRVWDFRYPYDPSVECPQCHNQTDDWRTDPAKPFFLANANIGGLIVFHCNKCGGTIRHKYFRDHLAREFTPA